MSKPLDVAIDIVNAVSHCVVNRTLLNVPEAAAEISARHDSAGCSREEIAEALEEELGSTVPRL